MSIYHERQVGNYCRLHAINNVIGKKIATRKEFDVLCDEYDVSKKYLKGTSKIRHYFVNSGETDNIFGYVLEKKGYKIRMEHHCFYKAKKLKESEITFGCIIYNRNHTFCVKKVKDILYKIDSMQTRPMRASISQFLRKGFGIINLYLI